MQVWNVLHAAGWKYRTQKSRQKSPSGHYRTYLSGCIFATKARIDNRKKILLSSNMSSSTCPHNMANFGPLAAEIDPVLWGTPAICHLGTIAQLCRTILRNEGTYWQSEKTSLLSCNIEVGLGFPSSRKVNPPSQVEPGVLSAIPVLQFPL